ncbi:MAG TPA: DUF115 domain-containing protein [Spirochaetota bacterium]|nr:DUF115 domain-containing protein [Spirochaetota bacterium]
MGSYILQDTKSGHKTLLYNNGREIRIHSKYDPVMEAERSAEAFDPGRADTIVVCGLGLGYHAAALAARFPDSIIIVIEKEREVIELARAVHPSLLETIYTIQSPGDLDNIFEELDLTGFTGSAVYYHRPSYTLHKDFYDGIIAETGRYISSKLSDLLTRFEFEEKWIENIFSNIQSLYTSIPVQSLFGKFKGYPGIIVSAGPSLKNNVAGLLTAKDRALIVCVDTALKILLHHGIHPHIVMTLDAQKHSIKHFLGIHETDTVLLADMVSYPSILKNYRGRTMISTTAKYYSGRNGVMQREATPAIEWIEAYTEPVGDIQSGGSVATNVFDLLLNLGCSSIILVGQDLAYTGREIHCSGTHHNENWVPGINRFTTLDGINQGVIRKRKIKRIDAFGDGSPVISDYVFDLYRGWFEDSAQKVSIDVINATEGGARIRNTREVTLEAAIREMPLQHSTPDEIINKAITRLKKPAPEKLLSAIQEAVREFTELQQIAEKENTGTSSSVTPEIQERLNTFAAGELLSPFLKRTFVYLARKNDVPPEKSTSMIYTDIVSASGKVIRILKKAEHLLSQL